MVMDDCNKLLESLYKDKDKSRKQFFDECVVERTMQVYKNQNDDFDKFLHNLDVYIDYNDINQVKKYVVKLTKLSASNRKTLIRTLGGLL